MVANGEGASSAGHQLGQLIGDWFEAYFVQPLLARAARKLDLFLDSRFVARPARGDKILWSDESGNAVDYDFVLELGGTSELIGVPVAFCESFWRRGARHSKDKARDDSGKLRPMRNTYPTARFLGIIAAGDFTDPARDLVLSQQIDLFYVPKDKVVEAFRRNDLEIDYPDRLHEDEKRLLASAFIQKFTPAKRELVTDTLVDLVGKVAVDSYVDRVRARLSALPQEIRLILCHESDPLVFSTVSEVTNFLEHPVFAMDNPVESYLYQVTFSDGSEFERVVSSLEGLKSLHQQMTLLADHMTRLLAEPQVNPTEQTFKRLSKPDTNTSGQMTLDV